MDGVRLQGRWGIENLWEQILWLREQVGEQVQLRWVPSQLDVKGNEHGGWFREFLLLGQGGVEPRSFFFLRTALKDSRQGPPTGNRQPATVTRDQPPPTANRQPPTPTNHQPPSTNRRQPPPAANRQPPPTANLRSSEGTMTMK